jgi:predicted Zn-dependent protease
LMRVAERDHAFALARYLAARAFVEARDPGKAEGALRRGLLLQPDAPVPYRHLADYYFGLDRTPEALGICQQGLDRFPRDPGLRMMFAQISAAVGRTEDAARAYDAVLSAQPDLDIVEYHLAMLLASNRNESALRPRLVQILEQLKGDRPSDPLLQDVLGWSWHAAGNEPLARRTLEAAVESAPDEPTLRFHLAAVYAAESKAELARKELTAALASGRPFPQRLEALRLLREMPTSGGAR